MVEFRIDVKVDPSNAIAGAGRVRKGLEQTENAADRLRRTLVNTFQAVAGALAIRQLIATADAMQAMANRLRVVSDSEAELAQTTHELLEISTRTRASFGATAELYARLAQASQELGRSQGELLQFTESLNQAIILSGANSAEAQAGLIQLSQGLASGALRGDELRSVLEQLPVVADVIARSLGVTRGQLRELGAEGRISADIVLDAFQEARTELAGRFGKTVPTVAQGLTVLRNEASALVAEIDRATGAIFSSSSALITMAEALRAVHEGIDPFRRTQEQAFDEAPATALGAQINLLTRELRALEQREIISPAALQRIDDLRMRLALLRGEARQATVGVEVAPRPAAQQAAADEERAQALRQVLVELERERELSELLIGGNRQLAEALQVVQDLREKGVYLTGEEQGVLVQLTLRNQALRDQAQALEDIIGPQEEINRQLAAMNELLRTQSQHADAVRQKMDELRLAALQSATDVESGFERAFIRIRQEAQDFASVAERAVDVFADRATDALVTFARTGKFEFEDFANALLDDLARLIARLLVVQALNAALGGTVAPLPQFGGARAEGGPVQPGRSYLVGEEGPELFTPSRAGSITPNGGGAAPQVHNHLQVVNVDDPSAVPQAITNGSADDAIVNVLVRNRDRVRSTIG